MSNGNNLEEENNRLKEVNKNLAEENDLLKKQFQALKESNNNVLTRLSAIEEQSKQHQQPPPSAPTTNHTPQNRSSNVVGQSSSDEISRLRSDVISSNRSITDLQNGWSRMTHKIENHEERLHQQHQYSCLNSLKIIGLLDIPEKTYGLAFSEYVLKSLKNILPAIADQLKIEDIDTSHPMSSARDSKSCVIVKFLRRDIRNLIFYQKRDLKNLPYKVIIVEHLNDTNLWYLREARKIVGFRNVWSSQCIVYALVNGKKVAVKTYKDLMYIHNNYSYRFDKSYANAASVSDVPATTTDSSQIPPSSEGVFFFCCTTNRWEP